MHEQTRRRPRIYVDGAKRPMQLSLTYTLADLDEILPPGTYRRDLVNAEGKALDQDQRWRDHSVASGGAQLGDDDDDNIEDAGSASMAARSDMRFIQEANVGSMQLAFQHNERTLASGSPTRSEVAVRMSTVAVILSAVAQLLPVL